MRRPRSWPGSSRTIRASGFIAWGGGRLGGPDDYADGRGFVTLCLHCLIDSHPEAGRGFDLAREHGVAFLVDGEWFVEDDEGVA